MEELLQASSQEGCYRTLSADDALNLLDRESTAVGQAGDFPIGTFKIIVPENLAGMNRWDFSMHVDAFLMSSSNSPMEWLKT